MNNFEQVLTEDEMDFMNQVQDLTPEDPAPQEEYEIQKVDTRTEVDLFQEDLLEQAEIRYGDYAQIDPDFLEAYDMMRPTTSGLPQAPDTYTVDMSEAYSIVGNKMVGRYDQYRSGTNNEEIHAMTQTNSEKWGRGLKKMTYGIGNVVLGGTIGSVTSLINVIKEGDINALGSDAFNTWLQDHEEIRQERFANYYTQAETDMNFLQSLGTANFYANDLTQGAVFLVGNIASEGLWAAATGGGSLALAPARWAFRTSKVAQKAIKMAGTKKVAGQIAKFSALGDTTRKVRTLGKAGQFANATRYMYTSAGYEAALESTLMGREAEQAFWQYHLDNGTTPTPEEMSEFRSTLDSAKRASYWGNLALVGTTNLALYGSIFNIKNPLSSTSTSVRNKVFGMGLTREGGKLASREASRLQRMGGWTYKALLRPAFHEGIKEEGLQASIEMGASSWIEQTYNKEAGEDITGMWNALLSGVNETYGGKEGWKEIGIGMIIGVLGGSFSGGIKGYAGQRKQYQKYVEAALDNSYTSEALFDKFTNWTRANKFAENYRKAEERGDKAGMNAAERDMMLNHIIFNDKYGMTEDALSDLKYILETSDNTELAQELGISESQVQEMKESFLEDYQRRGEEYRKNKEFANIIVGEGPLPKNLNSDRGKEELATAIAYNLTRGKDSWMDVRNAQHNLKEYVRETFGVDIDSNLKLDAALSQATDKTRVEFERASKRRNTLQTRIDTLENLIEQQQTEVLNASEKTRQVIADKLIKNQSELMDLQNQLTEQQAILDTLESTLLSESTAYADGAETVGGLNAQLISEVALGNGTVVETALEPIYRLLETLEETNPEAHRILTERLVDYKTAARNHTYFNETIKGLASPKFSLPTFATKLGFSLFGNKTVNEFTSNFVNNMFESQMIAQPQADQAIQSRIDDFEEQEVVQERIEIEEATRTKIKEVRDEISVIERELKHATEAGVDRQSLTQQREQANKNIEELEEVRGVLDDMGDVKDPYTKQVIEEERVKNEESLLNQRQWLINIARLEKDYSDLEKQLQDKRQELEDLLEGQETVQEPQTELERINKRIEDALNDNQALRYYVPGEPSSIVQRTKEELQGIIDRRYELMEKETLTEEEQKELENLNAELHEKYVVENYVFGETTLKDLLDIRDQLQQTEATDQTTTEYTTTNAIETAKVVDGNLPASQSSKNMVQTIEGVYMRAEEGIIKFSHLSVKGFIQAMGQPIQKVEYTDPQGNKVDVTQQAIDIANTEALPNTEGGYYLVTTEDGVYGMTMGGYARIQVTSETWAMIEPTFQITFMESSINPQRNVGTRGYVVDENGNVREAPSDFTRHTNTLNAPREATPREVYNTEEVEFLVDTGDSYNKRLLDDYNKSEKTQADKKKVVDNVMITITSKGKSIGMVRAGTDGISASESMNNYVELRRQAAEALLNNPENRAVNLEARTTPEYIYPGSPIFKMTMEEGEMTVDNSPSTEAEMYDVVAFGYIQDGQVTTNVDVELDSRSLSYVQKDNQKRPIIIKKYGDRLIALPIGIPQVDGVIGDKVREVVESQDRLSSKVSKINQILLEHGILPSTYSLNESQVSDQAHMETIIEELDATETNIDMDAWIEGNTVETLTGQVSVPIKDIGQPKVRLNFTDMEIAPPPAPPTPQTTAAPTTVDVNTPHGQYSIRRGKTPIKVDAQGNVIGGVDVYRTHKNGTEVRLKESGKAYNRVLEQSQEALTRIARIEEGEIELPTENVVEEKRKKCD